MQAYLAPGVHESLDLLKPPRSPGDVVYAGARDERVELDVFPESYRGILRPLSQPLYDTGMIPEPGRSQLLFFQRPTAEALAGALAPKEGPRYEAGPYGLQLVFG